jgi:diguanylate cyclase (GGDEF)-like protein
MDAERPTVFRLAATASLVGLAGLAAFVVHTLVPDSGRVAWLFDYPVYYGLVVLAVVLTVARAVLVPVHRAGWIAFAAAVTSFGAAEFVYQFYVVPHGDAYPSIADALYLGFYPLSYVGLILLFRARATAVTTGVWIDGVTAALAAGAIGSAILLEVVLETTEGPLSVVATNLAYPLGDVVLLAFVIAAFAITGWRPGRAWLWIGASLAVSALGDGIYLFASATGTYVEGASLDASWPAALLFVAFAAWQDDGREPPIDASGRSFLAVPAACGLAAIAVLVVDHVQRFNIVAVVLATLTLGAVLVRLALSFRENGRLLERSRHEAITDPLTGLGNRRRLLDDLERAARTATEEAQAALVVFDLDGFKAYNDAFGHPAGDALLARLGSKLLGVPGPGGRAYRLGGDEFCLLAPARAAAVGALVDAGVDALTEEGEGFAVTSSFGVVFLPGDANAASDALRLADQRLYAQKHQRRAQRDRPHVVLLQALYEREPSLQSHLEDVSELALAVGRELGLTGAALEELHRAAQLHDVGKIAIPDAILRKPGPLDDGDWAFVRQHTVIGERILGASPSLRSIGPLVRASHERWDGLGYPDGLAGEAIPLAARIVAACDAYDAMTGARPYRAELGVDAAIAELERCAGSQFDPAVVAVLVRLVRDEALLDRA